MRLILQSTKGYALIDAIHLHYDASSQLLAAHFTEDCGYMIDISQQEWQTILFDIADQGCYNLSGYVATPFTNGPVFSRPANPGNPNQNYFPNYFE